MKGNFIDFLSYLNENDELRREVITIANKHGFEFDDEVSDEELESVAGGGFTVASVGSLKQDTGTEENQTSFENFDQKSNQLFSILSTTLKSMKEAQSSVTRNIL